MNCSAACADDEPEGAPVDVSEEELEGESEGGTAVEGSSPVPPSGAAAQELSRTSPVSSPAHAVATDAGRGEETGAG
ncbi:hypothetical protein GCM10027060_21750 [Nesterenkonia halophila]